MKARVWLFVSLAVLTAFVVVVLSSRSDAPLSGGPALGTTPPATPPATVPVTTAPVTTAPVTTAPVTTAPVTTAPVTTAALAPWRPAPVFAGRFLVAYYGTAGTGSMGVLGSGQIPQVTRELEAAAAPFAAASGDRVQIVYELIVTMADASPGPAGAYSHDIPRSQVEAYLAAARRNHALVVLDLQPGRSDFLTVAKRYAWALRRPDVGLALDPEWRMGPGEVPGQVFGSVSAAEVNATATYVAGIARRDRLPQKLFVIHQFVPSSVTDIAKVRPIKGLAMVQHVDGWGSRQGKIGTYDAVARPSEFTIGFKLFYHEDVDMFSPAELLRALPNVRFVSYQ